MVASPQQLTSDTIVQAGAVLEIDFPFKRDVWKPAFEDEGPETPTWVPGWVEDIQLRPAEHGEYYERHCFTCQGWGSEERSVISVHKPGKYSTRIFYVRQWIDPDGKRFGLTKLRITTLGEFTRWVFGRRYEQVFPKIRVEPLPDGTPTRQDGTDERSTI